MVWVYATGFPHGFDIGKAIAKKTGDTDAASIWAGWSTQLKPSWEAIVVAQKPLVGSYVDNVLKWNVGGINIDACRIPWESEEDMLSIESFRHFTEGDYGDPRYFSANTNGKKQVNANPLGRWPANLVYFDSLFPGTYDKFFMVPKPQGTGY